MSPRALEDARLRLRQLARRRELDLAEVFERALKAWPLEEIEILWRARKRLLAGEPLPPDEVATVVRAGRAVAEERRRVAREQADHADAP